MRYYGLLEITRVKFCLFSQSKWYVWVLYREVEDRVSVARATFLGLVTGSKNSKWIITAEFHFALAYLRRIGWCNSGSFASIRAKKENLNNFESLLFKRLCRVCSYCISLKKNLFFMDWIESAQLVRNGPVCKKSKNFWFFQIF